MARAGLLPITESATSYWQDDTGGLSYTFTSTSYSYGTMGTYDASDSSGSNSFWGGGDSYSETGGSSSTDSGTDNSSQSSSDFWTSIDSQYNGVTTSQSPTVSTSQYYLSADIESGNDTTSDGDTSVATVGGSSTSSWDSATHLSSTATYTANENNVNNTSSYWSGDTGSDTASASMTSIATFGTSTTASWSDTSSSADSSDSASDQYSNSASYGTGGSAGSNSYSENQSGGGDSTYHAAGGLDGLGLLRYLEQ